MQPYRNTDPKSPEEVEFMENIFDCLSACIDDPEWRSIFLKAGVNNAECVDTYRHRAWS
jgi:hypothetical protein